MADDGQVELIDKSSSAKLSGAADAEAIAAQTSQPNAGQHQRTDKAHETGKLGENSQLLLQYLVANEKGREPIKTADLPSNLKAVKGLISDGGTSLMTKLNGAAPILDAIAFPRPELFVGQPDGGRTWVLSGLPVTSLATELASKHGQRRAEFTEAAARCLTGTAQGKSCCRRCRRLHKLGDVALTEKGAVFFGPGTTTLLLARALFANNCPFSSVITSNFEIALHFYLAAKPGMSIAIPHPSFAKSRDPQDNQHGLIIRDRNNKRNWGDIDPETIHKVTTAFVGFKSLAGTIVESDSTDEGRLELLENSVHQAEHVIAIGESSKILIGQRSRGGFDLKRPVKTAQNAETPDQKLYLITDSADMDREKLKRLRKNFTDVFVLKFSAAASEEPNDSESS